MSVLFYMSITVLVYVYFGYPCVVTGCSWLSKKHQKNSDYRPSVCILVAAHQEAAVIESKVLNFYEIDYPKEKLSMLVVSDGSTDGTDEIVAKHVGPRLKLIRQSPRAGKAAALGVGLPLIDSEIVVLTDANTLFDPSAVSALVANFGDARVGAVTGEVRLVDDKVGYADSEGAYYRYETQIQAAEARFWSVIGVDGALYAVRRELIKAPPTDAILDDFTISMEIACQGYRIVFEPKAFAVEDAPPQLVDEFNRKTRTAAGAFQALFRGWGVPRSNPRLMFSYFSHKLLRWLSPWFMLIAFTCNGVLAFGSPAWHSPWCLLFIGQCAFYSAALVGLLIPAARRLSLVSVPMYFAMMNAAMVRGLFRHLLNGSTGTWNRTPREPNRTLRDQPTMVPQASQPVV